MNLTLSGLNIFIWINCNHCRKVPFERNLHYTQLHEVVANDPYSSQRSSRQKLLASQVLPRHLTSLHRLSSASAWYPAGRSGPGDLHAIFITWQPAQGPLRGWEAPCSQNPQVPARMHKTTAQGEGLGPLVWSPGEDKEPWALFPGGSSAVRTCLSQPPREKQVSRVPAF